MAPTVGQVAGSAARATRARLQRGADRRAVARFAEFWAALQQVGDVLHEADRLTKKAGDSGRERTARHWDIASVDEVRSSLRRCRSSLRVVSASAKKFEPELIAREWRR